MPTYQPNIPQANELISVSQNNILENFQQLSTAWNVDHSDFNLASQGQHLKVTLKAPIADPNKATPIGSIYTKAAPTTILSDLYYQNNSTSNDVVQMTGGGITAAAWCYWDGTTLQASYNVTSVVYGGGGGYTVNFTRNFATTAYAAIITLDIDGNGSNATGVLITSRALGSIAWTSRNQSGGTFNFPFSAVFFGKLA